MVKISVKVKLFFVIMCMCNLPAKAVPKMTYALLGGTLNPTHLFIHSYTDRVIANFVPNFVAMTVGVGGRKCDWQH